MAYKIINKDTDRVLFEHANKAVVEDKLAMLKETMPEGNFIIKKD